MGTMMEQMSEVASKPLDTSGIEKGTMQGVQLGMQLAERRAQLEQQREEMEQKREYLKMQQGYFVLGELQKISLQKDRTVRKVLIEGLDSQMREMQIGVLPKGTAALLQNEDFGAKLSGAINVINAVSDLDPEKAKAAVKQAPQLLVGDTMGFLQEVGTISKQRASLDKLAQVQQASKMRSEAIGQRVGMAQDKQASDAGKSFDNDKLLSTFYRQKQGLDRALHTMETVKVLTPQDLNEIQTELATALSNTSQVPVSREQRVTMSTLQTEIATRMQQANGKPVDIRAFAPEIVAKLKDTLQRLGDAYGSNMKQRADMIADNFGQTSNPKVKAVVDAKLSQYAPTAKQDGGQTDMERKKAMAALSKVSEMYANDPGQMKQMQERVKQVFKKKTGLDLGENTVSPMNAAPQVPSAGAQEAPLQAEPVTEPEVQQVEQDMMRQDIDDQQAQPELGE